MADPRLLELAEQNQRRIKRFTRWRPSIERSYDDLLADIKSGELSVNYVPEDKWDAYKEENWRGRSMPEGHNLGGWYSDDKIHIPDTEYGRENTLPHEIMHYFAGHKAGGRGTPEKINPYIQADMDLGGWLPSLHPGGRRPTLPGKTKLGQWWNENMATKNVDYSDEGGYHPWFDEQAFDTAIDTNKTKRRNKMGFFDRFKDDSGLFQGGRFGRAGGRFKDWMEENTQDPYGHRERRAVERLEGRMGSQIPKDSPISNRESAMARDYALDFNANDPQSVRIMQKRLNEAGYTDVEGNPLDVDGVLGNKTLSAIRNLQSQQPSNQGQRFGFQQTPGAPSQLVTAENQLNEALGSLNTTYREPMQGYQEPITGASGVPLKNR